MYFIFMYPWKIKTFKEWVEQIKKNGAMPSRRGSTYHGPVYELQFYILSDEEIKKYYFDHKSWEAVVAVKITDQMILEFGKGKIEEHKNNQKIRCIRNLERTDIFDISKAEFIEI